MKTQQNKGISLPRWDWYGASIDADFDTALQSLCAALGAHPRESRGRMSYAHGVELRVEDRTLATMLVGG